MSNKVSSNCLISPLPIIYTTTMNLVILTTISVVKSCLAVGYKNLWEEYWLW